MKGGTHPLLKTTENYSPFGLSESLSPLREKPRTSSLRASFGDAGDVRIIPLDVTDDASIAAAAHIGAQTQALDVLINNAGIYVKDGDGAPSTVRLDAMRATYDVNVFGPLRVTAAFLPLLRAARNAHVVMVGVGLTVLPDYLVASSVREGRLVTLTPDAGRRATRPPTGTLWVAWRKSAAPTARFLAVRDWLLDGSEAR
ncbi:SDR family NAD(P)-dependent oxidoreductase [Myxococcus sp. SDU36]|nr:SDR family NAD(P)-dependent oxidoreductase [Myxococcus sp. SDU36]